MENCSICNSDYKKAFKSDHLKSVKHLEKLNQYFCKSVISLCLYQTSQIILVQMMIRTKPNNNTFGVKIVGKYISDRTRHFQSENQTLRSQNNQISQDTRSTQSTFGNDVKIFVNEKTYNKLKVNSTETLEEQINDLLS